MEARPLRSIVRGSLGCVVLMVVVDVGGGEIGLPSEAGCCFSSVEGWVEGPGWSETASGGVVLANSWLTSRLLSNSIALSNSSCFRPMTPSVQWSAPTGRTAFGCTRVISLVFFVFSASSSDTSSRNDLMLASSWGFEAAVTRGRHRKCVKGGFFCDSGLRWPFPRVMLCVGSWGMLKFSRLDFRGR